MHRCGDLVRDREKHKAKERKTEHFYWLHSRCWIRVTCLILQQPVQQPCCVCTKTQTALCSCSVGEISNLNALWEWRMNLHGVGSVATSKQFNKGKNSSLNVTGKKITLEHKYWHVFLKSINITLLNRSSLFYPPPCWVDHMDMRGGEKREEVFPLWKQEDNTTWIGSILQNSTCRTISCF